MTNTPPPSPTDDELARLLVIAYEEALHDGRTRFIPNEKGIKAGLAALARIRRPLEARGIEMAADKVAKTYGQKIAEELRFFARQHAET